MINFLKALIFPKYMVRFKSMNLFFAIAIFFISSLILPLPQMYHTSKERYRLVEVEPPYELNAFNDLTEDALTEIRKLGVKIENGAIRDRGTVEEFKLYQFESKEHIIFFAFDFYDIANKDESFNEEIFKEFHQIEVEKKKILVVFYLVSCTYIIPKGPMDLEYGEIVLDFSTITTGQDLSNRFINMFLPAIYRGITLHTFVSCVIYPIVIIVLIWLFFKFNGSTRTFKEYYNLASICAIVPLLVIFLISWIFPRLTLMQYFSPIFGIYYLIMIVIINSKTKIA